MRIGYFRLIRFYLQCISIYMQYIFILFRLNLNSLERCSYDMSPVSLHCEHLNDHHRPALLPNRCTKVATDYFNEVSV